VVAERDPSADRSEDDQQDDEYDYAGNDGPAEGLEEGTHGFSCLLWGEAEKV
jgi:hypothetical protein